MSRKGAARADSSMRSSRHPLMGKSAVISSLQSKRIEKCALLSTLGTGQRGDSSVDERQQKISVVLSASELDRFNSYCTDRGYKKSTLIRRLIREHLDREKFPAGDRPSSTLADHTGSHARPRKKGS